MPDIVSQRNTILLIANDDALYPAQNVYPSEDLFPKDPGLLTISNIVAGSLKLDEKICERIPQFGQLFATKFECKVYLTDNFTNKFIQVYQRNSDLGVYEQIFTGQIDSCKLDKVGTDRTIVAYDRGYTKGQQNIGPWWNRFWAGRETSTLKEARDSMLTYLGMDFEDVELPNDDMEIVKTVDISSCTMTKMLKMMCEISYCFPHINRYGAIEFIMLNTDPQETKDLSGLYEWTKSTFEEFRTAEIEGVQFYDSGDQLKWTVGNTGNAYPIRKNIFLYEKETEVLQAIGEDILDYLKDFTYTPAKVKMIAGDFDLYLGDYVHTEKGNFYVLHNNYSGTQLFEQTIEAKGQEYLYSGTPHIDYGELILNEKIARVIFTIEQFQIEYGNFKNETNAKFTITDTQISSKVSKGTVSSEISQEAGAISISANRLTIDSTNFKLAADGTITATNANLSGTLTAGSDSEGTKKKIIVQDGTITGYNQGVQQAKLEIGNGLFNIVGKLALNGVVGVSGSTSFVKDVSFQETSLGNVLTGFQTAQVVTGIGTLRVSGNATASGNVTVSGMVGGQYTTMTGYVSLPVNTNYSVTGSPQTAWVPHTVTQNTLKYVKAVKGSMGAIQSADGLIQSIS